MILIYPTRQVTVTYSSYIDKVLKQVHPDTGISNKAVEYSSYIYKVLKQVHHALIEIL
jgi:hypothetical protein